MYKDPQGALEILQGQQSAPASSPNEVFSKANSEGQTHIQYWNCPVLGNRLD